MIVSELRQLARSEGFALQPIKTRAPYLQGYGFSPATVIDVGVHDGTPWLYRSFPDADFVLVDPQAGSAEVARELGATFHQVALGEAAGEAVLNVPETAPGKGGAMASLLPRTDKLATRFTSIEEVDVQMTTLDALAEGLNGPFGLKIDTEGFEAPILAGGQRTLQHCEFVILELSVSKRFDGVAPPSQAISLLADAGLEFRDVLAMGSGPGKKARPRHMDVLFSRWAS